MMTKLHTQLFFPLIGALLLAFMAVPTALVDDNFADGKSQNQDLANNSLRLFNGRANTVRTDAAGSVGFDVTNAGGSEAFWAYFTNAGSPVTLDVGGKLSVALTFSVSGFQNNGQDVRFGVLDSLGTRNTANLTGGMNDATFVNDPGYGLQYFASGTGSPFVIGRRATLTGANIFNSFADFASITGNATGANARQAIVNDTPYTLTYTIERLDATNTRITAAVTGGALNNLSYAATETSPTPQTTFDYFAFRIGGTNFATKVSFSRLRVDYLPAPPMITTQPQPNALTVQVGSNVTLAVAASGQALTYQWQKDNVALANNASAQTPTLSLTNVQLGEAGNYTALVTNSSGSVTSNPVTLKVSVDPVPPPPNITTQPSDTTVPVGGSAGLSVAATGENLIYQWFKNGALLPGATNARLNFMNAQSSDSASYAVVVSNSSGSVTSNVARLLVVSTMAKTGITPGLGETHICIDTPLTITFDQDVRLGKGGKLRVYTFGDKLVDEIDLTASSQAKLIGGSSFNYYPIIVNGKTAKVYLHRSLSYNEAYYVTVEPGVFTDATGAPFAGFNHPWVWHFYTTGSVPTANAAEYIVAADGTGDFCTVQAALDAIPAGNTKPVTITVRRGTYNEIVYVPSNKPFITVRGEDRNQTIIQYANNAVLNPISTTTRTMFGVDAPDFTLENITLNNTTAKGGSQAEAFRGNNQRITLNRVNLKSFQDTLLLQGRGFVTDSYIEGDVDFMWGVGAVYFQRCELKATNPGYYTQIRNGQSANGNVFVDCKLTGVTNLTNVYLSRIDPTVFPYSQVIFINCAMGSHILPVGWLLNNATTAPNVQFWEYNSLDLDGEALDVSKRLNVARQLTDDEAKKWSDPAFVLGGWLPATLNATPATVSENQNLAVNFTAPVGHAAQDWVGLFRVGAPDWDVIARQYVGGANTGGINFTAPLQPGDYEFRYFLNDGYTLASRSNVVTVKSLPYAVTASRNGATITAKWTAPFGHAASDWIGLYRVGAADANFLARQKTGDATAGALSFVAPTDVGSYELRYFLNDGFTRAASSNVIAITSAAPLLALSNAEGTGAYTIGGRGGDVYHVTNLNDAGAGSLRNGISTATGARTIVFDLSGTINLQSKLSINKPFLTLAGQTAPGDGVTIAGWTTSISNTHDVIVSYLRFRAGDINCPRYQDDALTVDNATDVLIDHVSASWSVDESLSVTDSDRVTVQWSLITESLNSSCHDKGAHGYGTLLRYGNGSITFHHNLYAHHTSRNPRLGDNLTLDFVNNVVFDWGNEAGYSGPDTEGTTRLNYVGNYAIAGLSTSASKRARAFLGGSNNTLIYQTGNLIDSNVNGARDGVNTGWAMFISPYTQSATRFELPLVQTEDALAAYKRVLASAGASLVRDGVDTRIIDEVTNDRGRIINSQKDVGGWPLLKTANPATDTDQDGIPDQWESAHGLNPNEARDGAAITASGYSNLEIYLADLVRSK